MESIEFNCISDTESLAGHGNVVLSTTCFTTNPLIYGVFYGCTTEILDKITPWLRHCGESVFHPMILPMIFVELERKRLLAAAEAKGSKLHQRVLDMEIRSKKQENRRLGKREQRSPTSSTGDTDTIHMLLSMNALKNGLEALLEQLSSIRNHLGKPSDTMSANELDEGSISDACGVNIDLRLKEIMAELQSKVRGYEGLLGAITLATQMVRIPPVDTRTRILSGQSGSN